MRLPVHSYRIGNKSTARLINCYPVPLPEGAKAPFMLRRSPGVRPYCHTGAGLGRGLHVMNGVLYALTGSKLWRIFSNQSARLLGGQVPGTSPAFMANNGNLISISADNIGYTFDWLTDQVTPISDPDFVVKQPGSVKYIDNYISYIERDSGRWFISDLGLARDFLGLDFATAESSPDKLVTHEADHSQVLLLGTDSGELWENAPSGDGGFPFLKVINGTIEQGAGAEHGICKQDQSIFWFANDKTIRRLNGATAVLVSHDGFHDAVEAYDTTSDCQMWGYTLNGHPCVIVRFPTQGATWVYDCVIKEWHEREDAYGGVWDISGVAYAHGKTFVQRRSTGEIGVLDSGYFADWGRPSRAVWTYQPIPSSAGKKVTVGCVAMDIETGRTEIGAGEANLSLEMSDCGGIEGTFWGAGVRSCLASGKFEDYVQWDGLGEGRNVVLRCTLSGESGPLGISETRVEGKGITT